MSDLTRDKMVRGGHYNFKYEGVEPPMELKYVGFNWSGNGHWHQFERVGQSGVYCELLDSDLWMIEEIVENNP